MRPVVALPFAWWAPDGFGCVNPVHPQLHWQSPLVWLHFSCTERQHLTESMY